MDKLLSIGMRRLAKLEVSGTTMFTGGFERPDTIENPMPIWDTKLIPIQIIEFHPSAPPPTGETKLGPNQGWERSLTNAAIQIQRGGVRTLNGPNPRTRARGQNQKGAHRMATTAWGRTEAQRGDRRPSTRGRWDRGCRTHYLKNQQSHKLVNS